MHTVVYAYDGFDMTVEKQILNNNEFELVPSNGVDSPQSRAVLHQADALMITLQNATSYGNHSTYL